MSDATATAVALAVPTARVPTAVGRRFSTCVRLSSCLLCLSLFLVML